MGLLTSDDTGTKFKPVSTDGTRALGILEELDADKLRLVWVQAQQSETINPDETDTIVE